MEKGRSVCGERNKCLEETMSEVQRMSVAKRSVEEVTSVEEESNVCGGRKECV